MVRVDIVLGVGVVNAGVGESCSIVMWDKDMINASALGGAPSCNVWFVWV